MAISKRDKQMLKQLASLRDNRMRIAEFNVARGKKDVKTAEEGIEKAKEDLVQTREWFKTEWRRVNAELSVYASITTKLLHRWKFKRQKVRDKLSTAESDVVKAKEVKTEKEEQLRKYREKHREAVMAMERLKLLREHIK